MLDFLIDNIFVLFGGRVFKQTIGIPMSTICAPLFADLVLHANDADKDRKLDQTFNSIFCYIDGVGLSLSNYRLGDYLHRIYVMSLKLRILRILKSLLHHNLVDRYEISICQITMDLLFVYVDAFFPISLSRLLPNLIVYMSNLAGVL
jgi:hypothetical protein